MKKSICLTVCIFLIGLCQSRAQSLPGTQWKSFFAGHINDTATLTFSQDTSIITSSKNMELVRFVFHVSHDTISINDVGGPIACIDGSGVYKFSNLSNTLTLTVIMDPCDGRANSLSAREWKKVKNPVLIQPISK